MEDVSKALLIAATMFFAILILSLLVMFHNQISEYYAQQQEHTAIEQTQEINAKFENYHRNNIRGNDLISLMNRVIDYNATESYFQDNNYERIQVVITLGGTDIRNQFKFPTTYYSTSLNPYLDKTTITNTNAGGTNWSNDRQLVTITNTPNDLINMAESKYIHNVTDNKLQLLASKAESIFIDEDNVNDNMAIANRFYRATIIKDILGLEIELDSVTGKTKQADKEKVECIKEITSQYYQYMYFKRAYFDCTTVEYDDETNRVVRMEFKLQIDGGKVVFN